MGERRRRRNPRNMNRGLLGMDNEEGLTVGVGGGEEGESNGEKGRTTVTEQQFLKKYIIEKVKLKKQK